MITKISKEQPFQILTGSYSISPSSSGYDLEISADGKNYTKLFTVAANTTRLVTGVAANSYYRLKGNTDDEVVVNWMKQCVTEGGGGGDMSNYYTKAETNQEISNATQDMATETWVGQQGFLTEQSLSDDFYTKEQTDAAITAATAPIEEETEVISNAVNDLNERVTGLTETVETSNEVISTAINDINDRIEAVEKYVDEAGEVVATSLNDLNERLDTTGATLNAGIEKAKRILKETELPSSGDNGDFVSVIANKWNAPVPGKNDDYNFIFIPDSFDKTETYTLGSFTSDAGDVTFGLVYTTGWTLSIGVDGDEVQSISLDSLTFDAYYDTITVTDEDTQEERQYNIEVNWCLGDAVEAAIDRKIRVYSVDSASFAGEVVTFTDMESEYPGVTGPYTMILEGIDVDRDVYGTWKYYKTEDKVQEKLESGVNIKTINNQSILGEGNITIQGGGGSSVVSLTQAQYDALVASGTVESGVTYVITDATAVDLDDYALQADLTTLSGTVTANTASLADKADKQNVTARQSGYLPGWNSQGVITGGTRYYDKNYGINGTLYNLYSPLNTNYPNIWAPTSAGTAGQPLLSNGSGAPVWGSYKFAFITQTAYDALTTKDSTTIYFIIGD